MVHETAHGLTRQGSAVKEGMERGKTAIKGRGASVDGGVWVVVCKAGDPCSISSRHTSSPGVGADTPGAIAT